MKTNAMLAKATLWEKELKNNKWETFERLSSFVNGNEESISDWTDLTAQLEDHLNSLKTNITQDFSPTDKKLDWIRDSFSFDATETSSNLTTTPRNNNL